MPASVIDGREAAKAMRAELRGEAEALAGRLGRPPALGVLQVAGDAASDRYVRSIRRLCEESGASFALRALPADVGQAELEAAVAALSADPAVDGVIVQLPLPEGLDSQAALERLDPRKDVDGVTAHSAGLLMLGRPGPRPNTPAGGMELLRRHGVQLRGSRAVVVGRSTIVGRPMALMLLHEHATVTVAHSRTPDLAAVVREADVVVAAVGRAGLVDGSMLRPGAVVVDFGINVLPDGSVVGDVDYASAAEVAGAITPVPGGTGPMTNAMLLRNLLWAAERRWG